MQIKEYNLQHTKGYNSVLKTVQLFSITFFAIISPVIFNNVMHTHCVIYICHIMRNKLDRMRTLWLYNMTLNYCLMFVLYRFSFSLHLE